MFYSGNFIAHDQSLNLTAQMNAANNNQII